MFSRQVRTDLNGHLRIAGDRVHVPVADWMIASCREIQCMRTNSVHIVAPAHAGKTACQRMRAHLLESESGVLRQ